LNEKSNLGNNFAKAWRSGNLWQENEWRFLSQDNSHIHGFMGVGTWSEYCVFPETHVIKLDNKPTHVESGMGSVLSTGMFVT